VPGLPADPNIGLGPDIPENEEKEISSFFPAPTDPNVPLPGSNNGNEGDACTISVSVSLSSPIAVLYPPSKSTDPVSRIEGGEASLIDPKEVGGVPISISLPLSLYIYISAPIPPWDPNNEVSSYKLPFPPLSLEKKDPFFLYSPPAALSLSGALGRNLAGDDE